MGWDILLLIVGLALLYFGAEGMVQGASNLALKLGITPLIIGLTVVAFGTSAPELLVTLNAAIKESPNLSLGNILGSNICNIALILGVSSLIRPLEVDRGSLRRDYPLMILSSGLLYLFAWWNTGIQQWEGAVLFIGLLAYLYYNFLQVRKGRLDPEAVVELPDEEEGTTKLKASIQLTVGLIILVLGSYWVVEAAISIARTMHISEFAIAVSVIALGTSLPELATSAVASLKAESDISIGNVLGSNIFNVMLILGLVPMIFGLNNIDPSTLTFDFPVMMAVSLILYPIMRSGWTITRLNGLFLLAIYFSYVASIVARNAS